MSSYGYILIVLDELITATQVSRLDEVGIFELDVSEILIPRKFDVLAVMSILYLVIDLNDSYSYISS